jgi:hypothetical protein
LTKKALTITSNASGTNNNDGKEVVHLGWEKYKVRLASQIVMVPVTQMPIIGTTLQIVTTSTPHQDLWMPLNTTPSTALMIRKTIQLTKNNLPY